MKAFVFILSVLLAATSLSACGSSVSAGKTANDNVTIKSGSETSADSENNTDSLEKRKLLSDNLPKTDFGSADFIISTNDYMDKEYNVSEETGEIINDAIYKRNADVEERFNVVISTKTGAYDKVQSDIQKTVLTGEYAYDLIAQHVVTAGLLASKGLFVNWYDVPDVDFSRPWWAVSTAADLTYNGKAFLAIGDLALNSLSNTYCMFYDKVKAASYGIEDVYGLVNSGEWTIDRLSELTKDIYTDENGNNVKDYDDYYGFCTDPNSNINAYLWAFDNPVMKKGSDGKPELVIKTEKMNTILEKLIDFTQNSKGTYYDTKYKAADSTSASGMRLSRDMFYDGNTLFANGYFEMAVTHFRQNENDYGIIPYPKFDEKQESYKTMVDGRHAALAVPKTAPDLEKTGIITEALCAESYKNVIPAYYDVSLKVKFTRDEESIRMLDLIIDGRMFDFGYVYDGFKGASFLLSDLVKGGSSNFESYFASKESAIRAYYDTVIACFE